MIRLRKTFLVAFCLTHALSATAQAQSFLGSGRLTAKERLGKSIFFDTKLSSPPGQACASCHDAGKAFSDPDKTSPTSKGAIPSLKGSRNSPSIMYANFSPAFHFDDEGLFIGGQFLDGRAASLKVQAKQPFLNPIEMGNPDGDAVVEKVRQADYAPLFERVYGPASLEDLRMAYGRIADALAAFERSRAFKRFTSKYDAFLKGRTKLSRQEMRGRKVFEDPAKGNCAACHPDRPAANGEPPLFTDFSYDNLGVPRNPDNPFYTQASEFNPLGRRFVDKGLGGSVGDAAEDGKFKVPTLRNIAVTGPYMHNGYFKTLRGAVEFYSNRDAKPICANEFTSEAQALKQNCWPAPEVSANVNHGELGDLGLTNQEIDDLVAFLKTLTDGYRLRAGR